MDKLFLTVNTIAVRKWKWKPWAERNYSQYTCEYYLLAEVSITNRDFSMFVLTTFPGGSVVKFAYNAGYTGNAGSVPGSGRSPGKRNDNQL